MGSKGLLAHPASLLPRTREAARRPLRKWQQLHYADSILAMLIAVIKHLSDIVPAWPKEIQVRVCCRACGRLLGTYPFGWDAQHRLVVMGHTRRLHGAARFLDEWSPDGSHSTLSWLCGECKAEPQRRDDRWGRAEAVEGKMPTVHV